MFGFGKDKKKEEEEEKAKEEQVAQAMKSMSDQIAAQAQTIKQLQDQLTVARADDAKDDAAAKALSAAQAQLKQMQSEMEKLKTKAAAPTAPATGKAAGGAVGVTKVVAKDAAGAAAGALGGAGNPPVTTVTGGLSVGVKAYVQKAGGKNLRMRDAAGLESNVIAGLPPGTELSLLAGPVEKDGYPWWHIRASDGREGWVAGTELVTQPE